MLHFKEISRWTPTCFQAKTHEASFSLLSLFVERGEFWELERGKKICCVLSCFCSLLGWKESKNNNGGHGVEGDCVSNQGVRVRLVINGGWSDWWWWGLLGADGEGS